VTIHYIVERFHGAGQVNSEHDIVAFVAHFGEFIDQLRLHERTSKAQPQQREHGIVKAVALRAEFFPRESRL